MLQHMADAFRSLVDRVSGRYRVNAKNAVTLLEKALDDGARAAKKAERQKAKENAATKGDGAQYAIMETRDGKKYVRADRQVIFGNDPEKWVEQLENYINGKIRHGQDVILIGADGDELRLTETSAGKLSDNHTSDGRTMSAEAYERKADAAAHIDELAQVSVRGKKDVNDYDRRHGDMASGGWNYRTAHYMDFDGKYYEVMISVAKGADGKMIYNVGQMQERSIPPINGSSSQKRGAQREDASNRSVSGTGENVNTKYSLKEVQPVRPTNSDWKPGATFDEVKTAHPTLFALDADEADTRNPTQITGTVKSYRKIYDALKAEGFDGTILDASSGLGYGTRAGREEYGFDVDDIEPFPDSRYKPNYTDYSALDKTYDVIISNAVLNVMPQDIRDAMVVKIGEMLNPGGRAFINVRGTDVKNAGSKVAINDDLMEYFISNTGSYQKGFTSKELVSYLKDALGNGFTVEPTRKFGAVSAIVTLNTTARYSLKEDSDGRSLTKAQQEYFKDSKAVDSRGRLLTLYHQTDGTFTIFDPKHKGAGASDDGTPFGIFLKTSNRDIGLRGKTQMELYANLTNPMQAQSREDLTYKLRRLSPEYDRIMQEHEALNAEYRGKLEEAENSLHKFVAEWRENNPDVGRRAIYNAPGFDEVFDAANTITDEWTAKAEELSTQAKDVLTKALRDAGYDGVILHNDAGNFGRSTDAYIALNPGQVKNTSNKTPTGNPDIRYHIGGVDMESPDAIESAVQRALALRDSDATPSEIFNQTGLASLPDGRLRNGMTGDIVWETDDERRRKEGRDGSSRAVQRGRTQSGDLETRQVGTGVLDRKGEAGASNGRANRADRGKRGSQSESKWGALVNEQRLPYVRAVREYTKRANEAGAGMLVELWGNESGDVDVAAENFAEHLYDRRNEPDIVLENELIAPLGRGNATELIRKFRSLAEKQYSMKNDKTYERLRQHLADVQREQNESAWDRLGAKITDEIKAAVQDAGVGASDVEQVQGALALRDAGATAGEIAGEAPKTVRKQDAWYVKRVKGYVLIGAAEGKSGAVYIADFVVNRYDNTAACTDVLYFVNAKKNRLRLMRPDSR